MYFRLFLNNKCRKIVNKCYGLQTQIEMSHEQAKYLNTHESNKKVQILGYKFFLQNKIL